MRMDALGKYPCCAAEDGILFSCRYRIMRRIRYRRITRHELSSKKCTTVSGFMIGGRFPRAGAAALCCPCEQLRLRGRSTPSNSGGYQPCRVCVMQWGDQKEDVPVPQQPGGTASASKSCRAGRAAQTVCASAQRQATGDARRRAERESDAKVQKFKG